MTVAERRRREFEPGLETAVSGVDVLAPCPRCDETRRRLTVNSVAFDVLDPDRFSRACEGFVTCGAAHVVHFLAVHPTVAARQVPAFRTLLNNADLVVSDGAPIAALMRTRDRSARRVTSTEGFLRLCAASGERRLRHFFVGGASEAVSAALESELKRQFSELEIVGRVVPPFRPYTGDEVAELADAIRASGADVVWVGIGAPRQEVLAHRLRKLGAAPVIACIGATFDFVAGTKRRAPAWMRAVGFEWLYRFVQEPRRLWRRYLVGNTRFVGAVVCEGLLRLTHPRPRKARRA
jgi:N-acetylglucosaminyldiphosphoundecaprenol N-acetyl-beta-D-mannosaminyltransferase